MILPSVIAAGGGGGGAYTTTAVHFDGATAISISAPSSIANSSVVSFSGWFLLADFIAAHPNSANFSALVDATNYNFNVDFTTASGSFSGPRFEFCADVNDATNFVSSVNQAYANDGTRWLWIAGCLDTGHGPGQKIAHMVINGVDIIASLGENGSGASFQMQFNGITLAVPDSNDSPYLIGDVADLWWAPGQYVDFTSPAVQAKFWDGSKPISLGNDGSLPTGTAPSVFFSGNASTFATNRGTGGVFSVSEGTLTNASTSPSD